MPQPGDRDDLYRTTARTRKRCAAGCGKMIEIGEPVIARTFLKRFRSWQQQMNESTSSTLRTHLAHPACAVASPIMLGRDSIPQELR
jgi:hypothetical protein